MVCGIFPPRLLDRLRSGWNAGRGGHPEAPAWSVRRRARNALRLARWGHRKVVWLAGEDGRVPGTDRPWQAGDRFEIQTASGKVLRTCGASGIDQQLADDLNWALRWTVAA